jgi:hypothetical protein
MGVVLGGCSSFVNIEGVYFPSWVASLLIGCVLSGLAVAAAGRSRWKPVLPNPGLVFVCLATVFTVAVWFLLFRQ